MVLFGNSCPADQHPVLGHSLARARTVQTSMQIRRQVNAPERERERERGKKGIYVRRLRYYLVGFFPFE